MNKKIKNLTILILFAVGVGFSIKYYFAENEQNLVFTTDFVKKGNIENVVLTNGVLYPYTLVDVGSQASGQIDNIAVNLGDQVKKGDLIAQIDNLTQKNTLKEAQASLSIINAQYRAKQAQIYEATAEFERQQKMFKNGVASQSIFDTAQATLTVYSAELEQIEAQKEQALISVDNAKLELGYTTIVAPIDGTVIYISAQQGQTISNNQETPSIVELAQLTTMTIKAEVSEADVIHIKPGQQVYFSILGDTKQKYTAVLRAIEPGPTLLTGDDSQLSIGDSDAIYYNALFDVDNPDRLLRIGMTAQVSIILDSAADVLQVPAQVLTKTPNKQNSYQVPVKVDNKVEYRDVEVGINNSVNAQILSGLEEGDEIILGQSSANQATTSSRQAGGRQKQAGL
ncbi:efflux RND transporter periplasmic adaptor subunit [Psychromonas sp. SR45-3]|uniref:efflux RND transporter periplasmic adaptor subunit n=1 Tax=Psychromonas sp. SR45-3 TaxID=2760930 RepID=UPI0015FE7EC9|nr:efflux RND transporter periplasmic adaptor subunit [Psychromonas sp. SR45-3]MBB1271277.1 efflux RND transporter periplasmic adaptor subunit [Psychromonas sp. SR45-3]